METKQHSFLSFPRLLILVLIIIIGALACKRSTDFSEPQNVNGNTIAHKSGGSIPSFSNEDEVDAHLKWIARGLANWPKPLALIRGIDSLTTITTNDSNENSITYLNTLYAFGGPLADSINTRFTANDYDSDGLESFNFNGETYYTRLYIPNKYYNINKPFVVIADEIQRDSIAKDTVKGYFYKPGGGIDSVLITEDNDEDYYIWVVNYYSLKDFDKWYAKQGDSLIRKSGRVLICDNDGVCDPGEKYNPNCTDCYPLPPQMYRLEITQMEVFRDNCPKAEKWINGQYEFCVTYGLYDGTGNSTHTGTINDYYPYMNIKELDRKEVCRERCIWGGSRGNNCPSHIHNVNYVLYKEIEPSDTGCQMPFIFFELDFGHHTAKEYISPFYELAGPYQAEVGFHPFYYSWNAAYVATTINVHSLWLNNGHNGSFIWVGNNEAKVKIELIKL